MLGKRFPSLPTSIICFVSCQQMANITSRSLNCCFNSSTILYNPFNFLAMIKPYFKLFQPGFDIIADLAIEFIWLVDINFVLAIVMHRFHHNLLTIYKGSNCILESAHIVGNGSALLICIIERRLSMYTSCVFELRFELSIPCTKDFVILS